jgi:hypothetical protein
VVLLIKCQARKETAMKTRVKNHDKGQSLVIVALMMVALIAILALSLDGGFTFVQRRRAQNAADAGALAGARLRCTSSTVTDAEVIAEAKKFAQLNGIDDPEDVSVTVFPVVSEVHGVEVTVNIPFDTFFAGALGIDDTEVGAVAEAACYPPCDGTGLLPIAWSCSPDVLGENLTSETCNVEVPRTSEDDICEFKFDEGGNYVGDPIYIIVDSATVESTLEQTCAPVDYDDCSYVPEFYADCDLNNDCEWDIDILSGGSKAWIDLNGGGGGANELIDWVNGEYNGPPLKPHTWFPGQTGVTNSVYQAIEGREGDIVTVPVFDTFHKGKDPLPPLLHPEDTIVLTSAGAADYFHVVTFASFLVDCVDAGGTTGACDAKNYLVSKGILKANDKTVEGCFLEKIIDGGGKPGECTINAGSYILRLTE